MRRGCKPSFIPLTVNAFGGFGKWCWDVSFSQDDIEGIDLFPDGFSVLKTVDISCNGYTILL